MMKSFDDAAKTGLRFVGRLLAFIACLLMLVVVFFAACPFALIGVLCKLKGWKQSVGPASGPGQSTEM